jgi:hypothetical protein
MSGQPAGKPASERAGSGRARLARVLRNHVVLLGLAAIAFVALAYLTAPSMFEGVDFWQVHTFYKEYLARALRAGRFPLWNPHINLGRPFHADSDSAIFYPPHLLYLLFDVRLAWAMLAMAHVWLALCGTMAFLRAMAVEKRTAFVLSLAFLASAPMVEPFQNGLVHYAVGLCYLPWVLLLSLRLQDEPAWGTAGKLALLVGLQYLGGHAQVSWISMIGSALLVVGRGPGGPGGIRATLVSCLRLAGCCAWGLALASVHLLPLLELASQGNRHATLAFTNSFPMPWYGWSSLLAAPGPGFPLGLHQANLFCGAAVLLGGLCGLTQVRDRNVRALLVLAGAATLAGAGDVTPFFRVAHAWLPGFSSFRLHARFLVLPILALVAACGIFLGGASSIAKTGAEKRLWIIGALVLGLTVAVELHAIPVPLSASAGAALVRVVFVVGAWLLLLLLARWRGPSWSVRRKAVVAGFLALAASDLALAVAGIKAIRARPFSDAGERAVARLLGESGLLEKDAPPPRVSFPMDIMRPNAGMRFGFSTFAGYTTLTLDRVFAFMYGMRGLEEPVSNSFPASNIYDAGPFPYRAMNLVLGFDHERRQAALTRTPDPRAYLVHAAQVVPDFRAAIAKMKEGHDFHQVVLLESAPPRPLEVARRADESVRIRAFAPEHIEIEVDASAPALLVLAEAWFPGWTAKVDGRPAPCVPGNAWMRVVPVPQGRVRVELSYSSTYLPAGAALSLVALLGLAVMGVTWCRRRLAGTVHESQ